MVKIYKLIDPRTNNVRYVGKTITSLRIRLAGHMCEKENTYKKHWIDSLKREGLKPLIQLIEEVDNEHWVEREKYWISFYENLCNYSEGGDGCSGFNISEETRERMSKARLGKLPGNAKITQELAAQIYEELKKETPIKTVVQMFNTTPKIVKSIKYGHCWGFTPLKNKPKVKPVKLAIGEHFCKAVEQYDLNGNLIGEFKSIKAASEATSIHRNQIESIIKGRIKKPKNFVWKIKNR